MLKEKTFDIIGTISYIHDVENGIHLGKNLALMRLFLLSALTFLLFLSTLSQVDYRKLHQEALVVDTHNDVVQRILEG